MSRHTPGPWMVTDSGGDVNVMDGCSIGIDDEFGADGGRTYFLATVVHGDPDELRANAELVAAAPELLAALKKLLHMPEFDGTPEVSLLRRDAKRAARAAITKAGG